ncbi:SIMPL domain-containing protein [Devosia sp. XJ19-1]|uniref:SIMPL domain-containing protein n=1 Tax=Devosia ureilytica TaxID=2952754 RepID=A0A9Q4APD3_9HYPH|nr:SIMPL domain-containing protein [Devosia ureilytica]MCP8883782.1 SIMPL domain-containing protein [Devosia ureilytica]MCP8887390.1 SIMPL domain-containing protein [Devosia ureilytica]
MRALSVLAPFALLASVLPAYAGTIAIEGRGEVRAAPDMATINSGVTSQGATAREALDANTTAMNELIAALKEAGIEARDIQTSGFSVNPNYVYSDARDDLGYSLPPRINGYQVSNSVTVVVRDLENLGAILDKSVTVGANTVNGVSFSVADPSELLDEARKAAFANARDKAELYAGVADATLGELVSISEQQTFDAPQPYPMYARAEMSASAPVPVEAGEMSFAITVNVSWDLNNSAD